MTRILALILTLAGSLFLAIPTAFAGTDEFFGDSSIYAGVAETDTRPNVLIIIDNSRSTENTAGGEAYVPWDYVDPEAIIPTISGPHIYPLGKELDAQGQPTAIDCTLTSENPARGCYLPWNIYEMDIQGDFSRKLITNDSTQFMASDGVTTFNLSGLTCDPTGAAGSKSIHKAFMEFGTYSGSASPAYPTLDASGVCISSGNTQSGKTYALGNYLNYAKKVPGTTVTICNAPVVSVTETRMVCEAGYFTSGSKSGQCKAALVEVATTGYYQLRATIVEADLDSAISNPTDGTKAGTYWGYLGGTYAGTSAAYVPGYAYTMPASGCASTGDTSTQREIIHEALDQVIKATAGVVNFGAMVYGNNNSGAQIIRSQYDGTFWTDMQDLTIGLVDDPANPGEVIVPSDCNRTENAALNICKFIKALPGPTEADGAPRSSSNANRPLGESVFDAGYYFGATYSPVTNTRRIPTDIINPCNLNHIILLTNGLSNGDGSPRMTIVGDADADGAQEEVYGLGSHWLDDVAKHLLENYKIKTHTVLAFQAADALIRNAAKDGGGQTYNVYSAEELAAALFKLLGNIINEKNTSFVAPVVPASTTNRTISSSKVYLGLFRPQQDAPWHGNIKKYGISSQNYLLADKYGDGATDVYGNFDRDSVSFWSQNNPSDPIPSASSPSGYINPNETNINLPKGDGGQVDAGGAGGVLLERIKSLRNDMAASGTWEPGNAKWRKIYTYLAGAASPTSSLWEAQNRFAPGNPAITSALLDLRDETGILVSPTEVYRMILFMHGFDPSEPVFTPANIGVRKWVLGDVLHSRPLVFNYTKYNDTYDGTCPPSGNTDITAGNDYNSSILFVGANDGMLHAFRDCSGEELWAFIPPNALEDLQYIRTPAAGHATFVDSAPTILVYDQDEDGIIDQGTDKVVLIFGQRRGGGQDVLDTTSSRGAYYALDVSNPYQPVLLWEFDNLDLSEMGETWSQPRLARVKVDDTHFKLVAFVGTGYDNNEDFRYGNTQAFPDTTGLNLNIDATTGGAVDGADGALTSSGTVVADSRNAPRGRGLVAIEVADYTRADAASAFVPTVTGGTVGTAFWSYTHADNAALKYSFPSDLTVVDFNSDGFADTIYTGDTGGNLWRFDISADSTSSWSGEIIFTANPGADGTNGRKIFYRPTVVTIGAPHLYFGTGDREHPLNLATVDRLYCVIDWKKTEGALGIAKINGYPIVEADLDDVTANQIQDLSTDPTVAEDWNKRLYSGPAHPYNPFSATQPYTYGWYIKLDGVDRNPSGDPGEKMLAPATIFNGQVFFSTYQLYTGPRAGCEAGNLGISRLYQLNYKTGEAVLNFDETNDLDTTAESYVAPANERAVAAVSDTKVEIMQRSDRVRTLGEGIPSGIVSLIDASGRVTLLISSSDKVEASGLPDVKLISPVYWMQW